ncbi:MAG: iron-containing redox enzyme family protein [Myxococcota bacterium]
MRDQQLMEIDRESHAHPAIHHIWLENVSARRYVDMESTLRFFARDYYAYSSGFPIYLRKLIGKLEHPEHRKLLERNLREEQGGLDPADSERLREAAIDRADVEGIPHPELYRRFCRALGLYDAELDAPESAGHLWRQRMIEFLDSASPPAALGALGAGTEAVVLPIYRKLLRGIRELSAISARDRVFFELHCMVDDQHSLDLRRVAYDLLGTPGAHNDMRNGMLEALQWRQDFFTHQQLRPSARLIGEPA